MVNYNFCHISINFQQYYFELLINLDELFVADHIHVTVDITYSNFLFLSEVLLSQVTAYIFSISWYRGSIVLDNARYHEIDYRKSFTRLLSRIRKLKND